MSKDGRNGIQSVQSAVRVVEEMAALGEAVGVTALANRIQMPKVRVFRYLRTLQALGYVEQNPQTEKYALTLRLFHVGQAVAESTELLRESKDVLVRLRDRVEMSAVLSQPEADGVRILDSARMDNAPVVLRAGSLLDFHASAQGRACLAFGPRALWESVRETELRRWTPLTTIDPGAIELELEASRQRGWTASAGQTAEGVNAVAAPIYAGDCELVATINVVAGSDELCVPPPEEVLEPLLDAAQELSCALGYEADVPAVAQKETAPPSERRDGPERHDSVSLSARPEGG